MSHPKLTAVVAMSENRVIGRQNQLPWHLPADLKHFKAITTGHPILMGRKTHESIGRPLPNRLNIVMTTDQTYTAPGCEVVHTLAQAIEVASQQSSNEIMVIGGATIYQQLMPAIERIYLTIVHAEVEGDVYFPALKQTEWQEKERLRHEADAEHAYAYSFCVLEKRGGHF